MEADVLGRELFNDDDEDYSLERADKVSVLAVSHPLALYSTSDLSENSYGALRSNGSTDGFETLAEALNTNPVELAIFKQHTWWPGILFRTVQMERVFLDGYARLQKNLVYTGYVLIVVISILVPLQNYVGALYRFNSTCPEAYESLCVCAPDIVLEVSESCLGRTAGSLFWQMLEVFFAKSLPILAAVMLTFIGVHYFIHRSERIKEKTWSMLSSWLAYAVLIFFIFGTVVNSDMMSNTEWNSTYYSVYLLLLPSYIYFGGNPSFLMFLALCILMTGMYCALYFVALDVMRNEVILEDNLDELKILESFWSQSIYSTSVWTILTLCGAFVQVRADLESWQN